MEKVITAVFQEGGGNTVTVYGLWQWDHGISLQIMGLSLPETVEVHFALTNGEPVKQEGKTTDGITTVDIPDSMLAGPTGSGTFCGTQAFLVNAWVYVEDGESGRTVKMVRLNVKTRAKPPDYIATPDEKKTWEQLQEGKADRLALAGSILSLMSGERLLSEVTLPTGGGEELADIRVGADGKIYNSAGEAVRVQVGELKGDLDNILLYEYGVNLFDENSEENKIGYLIDSDGNIYYDESGYYKNVIVTHIIPISDISMPIRSTSDLNARIYAWGENRYIGMVTDKLTKGNPVYLPEGTTEIRFFIFRSMLPIMFYQSEDIIEYEPYRKIPTIIGNIPTDKELNNENLPANSKITGEKILSIEGKYETLNSKLETYANRSIVNIFTSDTEEEIFLKLRDAIEKTNCDVYFEHGTYNFSTIFDLMYSKYSIGTAIELPLGGNCRYYFNGSTLIATQISDNATVIGNASLFGSRRIATSFELYDATFIANGTVYVFHDESSGMDTPFVHKYSNIRMVYNESETKHGMCFGGGTGLHGTVIMDTVIMETNSTGVAYDGGFHGNGFNAVSHMDIRITNSWFSKRYQTTDLRDGETIDFLFCGNHAETVPDQKNGYTTKKFNNNYNYGADT